MKKEQLTELIIKVQKGDSEAANTFFYEIYKDVYFFAFKTVKDSQLAEDITQEALIAIFKNINSLKDPVAFPAWSRQVTYSQCTRYFRKTHDVLLEENEDGSTAFDILEEDKTEFIPHEALDKKDLQKTIASFIDTLSPDHRTTIMLYYFDELPISKIAEIQGITESAVKSRLYFARQAIKARVEEYEKKTGIRLHALPFLPFVKWIYSGEKAATFASPAAIKSASQASISAYSASTAAASAAGTATASAATAGAAAAKAVGIPLAAKIIAGVAAAAIAISVPVAVFVNKGNEEGNNAANDSGTAVIENSKNPSDGENDNGASADSDFGDDSPNNAPDIPVQDLSGYSVRVVDNVTYIRISNKAEIVSEYIMADGNLPFENDTNAQGENGWLACPGGMGEEVLDEVTSITILEDVDGIPVWKPVGDFSAVFPNLEELSIYCSSVGGVGDENPFAAYKDSLKRLVIGERVGCIYNQFSEFRELGEIIIEGSHTNSDLEGLFIPDFSETAYAENKNNWETEETSDHLVCSGERIYLEPNNYSSEANGLREWEKESVIHIPKSLTGDEDMLLKYNEEDDNWAKLVISPDEKSYYTVKGYVGNMELMSYFFSLAY